MLSRHQGIDNRPHCSYTATISLTKGAFREGTFGRRSECGARARMNAIRSRADPGR